MFPLRDDIPTLNVPVVNYAIIGMCVVVFLAQMAAPDGGEQIIGQYGMVPYRVVNNDTGPLSVQIPVRQELRNGETREVMHEQDFPPVPISPWMTLFTCMFLHGGLMHIVGNMWFLVIFGDNVEDRFGHVPYFIMYILCGLAAGILQIVSGPSSMIPTVGASGAIAGVMGSYMLLYPHARVVTLVPLGIIWTTVLLPAPVFLGIWFLFQFVSAAFAEPGVGGVAFWAHVGGFVSGLAMTWWGRQAGWLAPPPQERLADPSWQDRFA